MRCTTRCRSRTNRKTPLISAFSIFADIKDVRTTLPLHPLKNGDPYYIGFFITGAYQDIMGDLHNLFGRVNEAHVFLDPDEESGFYIEETIPGNTIAQVLELTEY